ncbi:hypothetical protein GCM10023321_03820 [Pseudonocardia eucalypti]|uniref:Ribonuclease VapC n=1 Tax=Pseudonocardia eucalypti TaxID=648755 RepID=A0ABP9PF57_9PSEU|nr:putative nucleic acid-binding protein [Pseudonocardia eucalypti]
MTSPPNALVDTSVWIKPPAGGLSTHAAQVAISIVSVAELHYGTTMGSHLQNMARRSRLRTILDSYEVLPLDEPTTELYGAFAAMVHEAGRNPRPRRFDLLIAATAARHRLTLLTRDKDGFVGLEAALRVVQID